MAKVKGKIAAKVKKSNNKAPVKAGSTPRPHGGFPTRAVIVLTNKIKKKNG